MSSGPLLVYFSSATLNTHRFVEKLGIRAIRIPIAISTPTEVVGEPFVLVCPTYAHDDGAHAVPKQVIKFLNDEANRNLMLGVIASGNRNFGANFALAGTAISRKCGVPVIYKFELSGTSDDVTRVKEGLERTWTKLLMSLPQTQILKQA